MKIIDLYPKETVELDNTVGLDDDECLNCYAFVEVEGELFCCDECRLEFEEREKKPLK